MRPVIVPAAPVPPTHFHPLRVSLRRLPRTHRITISRLSLLIPSRSQRLYPHLAHIPVVRTITCSPVAPQFCQDRPLTSFLVPGGSVRGYTTRHWRRFLSLPTPPNVREILTFTPVQNSTFLLLTTTYCAEPDSIAPILQPRLAELISEHGPDALISSGTSTPLLSSDDPEDLPPSRTPLLLAPRQREMIRNLNEGLPQMERMVAWFHWVYNSHATIVVR
jgi:hypothetical protein